MHFISGGSLSGKFVTVPGRRKHTATTVIAVFLMCAVCAAQELELPISPTPVGSGARAAGMGSAFVAVADDATAASWNPAGLVQLERPEISAVGSFNGIQEFFDADPSVMGFESTQTDTNLDLNFMSAVYPLPWTLGGRNATVSLSFQQKYDLSRDFSVDFLRRRTLPSGSLLEESNRSSFNQDGGLSVITPAFAVELTNRLAVGVAVNLWRDNPFGDGGWSTQSRAAVTTTLSGNPNEDFERTIFQEYDNVEGENVSIGLLWNATDKLSIGARYDSRMIAEADFFQSIEDSRLDVQQPPVRERRRVSIPEFFAVGAAYRFSDRFTLSMDVTTADWNDFYVESEAGLRLSLVDAQNLDDPDDPTDFDRTFTVRLGAEYVFIPERPAETMNTLWTLRGGLFFDQEPASGRPTEDPQQPGNGEPDNFYGFTIGAGLLAYQRVNFDIAYELRYGHDVNTDFVRGIPNFREDVLEHRVLFSTVIYF